MSPSHPTVERVEAAAYTVPTERPEADGTLAWDSTTMVLVRVAGGGSIGLGWTYGATAVATVVRDLLADTVVGRPALDVPGTWQAMVRRVRNATRPGAVGYAVSAVDVALWDLKARLLGVPLHRLLGVARQGVPVYGSGGFTTYDEPTQREQFTGWLEQGIGLVKMKIGESWGTQVERDLVRMRQARETVGDRVALMVDANGGYTRKQAVRVAERVADLDVVWFEEPVSSDDLDGLRVVRDQVRADVAAGEYGTDLAYFHRMCPVVDCLQIDLTRCGGTSEWLRAAAVAAGHGLDVSTHTAPHVHLAAAAATPNFRHLEWFADHVRIERMFFDGAREPVHGMLWPDDDRPGLGVDLRESDAEPYRVA